MKLNKILVPTLLLLVLISSVGCNAYEDGPLISLRSKESRLLGSNRIVLYEINGIDSLSKVALAFENTSYENDGFLWLKDGETRGIICTQCISGYWNFQNDEQDLRLVLPKPLFSDDVFPTGNWNILRLTNKELWIEINSNGNIHFVKLNSL